MSRKKKVEEDDKIEYTPFEDPIYAHSMQELVSSQLKKGNNVVNMPNGDIVVTETKTYQTLYSWDREKRKLIKKSKT